MKNVGTKRFLILKRRMLCLTLIICLLGSFLLTGCASYDEEVSAEAFDEASKPSEKLSGKLSDEALDEAFDEAKLGAYGQTLKDIRDTAAVRESRVKLKGGGEDQVTVLVYVNGSDLETEAYEATGDLKEMIAAGSSPKVNILVQTMGAKKWSKSLNIASDRSQRYRLNGDGLELLEDDLGLLDCTDKDTLCDFIKWGKENYPADRYILQFWDHGAGSVYGFGPDQNQDEYEMLTIDEMKEAFDEAGVFFDFIGMDCCIMSCIEVACAFVENCDYMILSEDFESGLGWSYEGFISKLMENSSTPTTELARIAIDDMVEANEDVFSGGDKAILTLIDESMMYVLFAAWRDFAYANEDVLLGTNYSRPTRASKRLAPIVKKQMRGVFSSFFDEYFDDEYYEYEDEEDMTLSNYFITDIMSVADNIDSKESDALRAALSDAIVYNRATSENESLTGLAVTLPYGDAEFYKSQKDVYTKCGFDSEYIKWLGKFVDSQGVSDFYDYDSWDDSWNGWDSYEDDYDWSEWDYFDECDEYGGCDSDDEYDYGSYSDYDYDDYDYDEYDYYDDYDDYGVVDVLWDILFED